MVLPPVQECTCIPVVAQCKKTTVVNTHDMNSVLGIGDYILFMFQGQKCWEGDRHQVLYASSKELNDFMFASKFLKEIREKEQEEKH